MERTVPVRTASTNVIAKYLPVYFVLLGIAGVEVLLAIVTFRSARSWHPSCPCALQRNSSGHVFHASCRERRSLFLTLIPVTILFCYR